MMLSRFLVIIFSYFLVTHLSDSGKEENQWTRFRGVNGSGIDTNWEKPVRIDSTGLRWITNLPGKGNSSPVVWNNKIFITSSNDEKRIGYVTAISDMGEIIWQKEFDIPELSLHVDNKLASSTPAIDDNHIYLMWLSKEKTSLIALTHDGEAVWEKQFDGIISRHGGGNSLMLYNDHLIFSREQEDFSTIKGTWVALEKSSGNTVWELQRTAVKANSFSTPVYVELENKSPQLIFASQAHGLTGVDPSNGHVLWEKSDLLPARVVASPIHSDGMIVACCKGETVVYDIDPPSGQLADTAKYLLPRSLSPYVPTPIIIGDHLYTFLDNGTVACIELETGQPLWKKRPAGPFFGSPISVAGNIYAITKAGEIVVVKADTTYSLVSKHKLDEGSFSTPAMCKKGMVIRTFSKVMLFGS